MEELELGVALEVLVVGDEALDVLDESLKLEEMEVSWS